MALSTLFHTILKKYTKALSVKYRFDSPNHLFNINLDLCNPTQKRVLLCYVPLFYQDLTKVNHALLFHANQILQYFIKMGFCVDLCSCHPDHTELFNLICDKEYDIVFGFGNIYKRYCEIHPDCKKLLFMTENNPVRVKELYSERIIYFKQRHPRIDSSQSSPRMEFYTEEMMNISDGVILMTSEYNASSFKPYFKDRIWRVNGNALINPQFRFDKHIIGEHINKAKHNFLWFGSRGLIHKGLDILIDAFAEMPDLTLNCYGISETHLFDQLKKKNTINKGRINVFSDDFIKEVVYQHNFVILDSCSEGMSTAITTCMCHGIVPIITKECGFDPVPCIIELDNYDVNTVVKTVRKVLELSDDEILSLRKQCYEYANDAFSIESFSRTFAKNMDEYLSEKKSIN